MLTSRFTLVPLRRKFFRWGCWTELLNRDKKFCHSPLTTDHAINNTKGWTQAWLLIEIIGRWDPTRTREDSSMNRINMPGNHSCLKPHVSQALSHSKEDSAVFRQTYCSSVAHVFKSAFIWCTYKTFGMHILSSILSYAIYFILNFFRSYIIVNVAVWGEAFICLWSKRCWRDSRWKNPSDCRGKFIFYCKQLLSIDNSRWRLITRNEVWRREIMFNNDYMH